jgi:predicted RNA binding protein YcfA (HicA-like mRNA interferase family)
MGFTLTAAQMKKLLASKGFRFVSQRGSHQKMTDGANTAIVPSHNGDLPTGTMRGILSDAGISLKDAKTWAGKE